MEVSRVRTLALLLIALALPACDASNRQPLGASRKRQRPDDTRKFTVAVVESKSATIKHDYKCRIYGQYSSEVWALADGYLAEVSVKEGQVVKKGDPLFKIRPPGDGEKRPDDGDRVASSAVGRPVMAGDTWFTFHQFLDEEKPKAGTPDQLISIEAPSDGVIARLPRQPGQFVWKRDFLTTVVRTGVILADFHVPESDYLESVAARSTSQQNQQLRLILADRSEFPHAGQSCEALSGSNWGPGLRFRAKFPNPDGRLVSGRSGMVSVSRDWKDAISLPRAAAFWDRNERYVYVVGQDHVAHRRGIVVGDGDEDSLVVKEGVGVGDRIVVEDVEQVREGDKVE